VFIADGLVALLSAHVAANPVGPHGWLFTGPTGDPHQNTVGYWWRQILRDAELSGIKLHDLRHFFASGPIAEGYDVVTVQRALGHSKPTTTLNTYAHLWPTAEDRTRKAAQNLIDAAIPEILRAARVASAARVLSRGSAGHRGRGPRTSASSRLDAVPTSGTIRSDI
jgi:integrase